MDKVVGPVAQAAKSGKSSKRLTPKRRSGIFLLEPRVMYDGAAAATVAATTHHHDHAHNPDDPQGGPVDHPFHGFTPHDNSQGGTSGGSQPTANFSAPTTVTPGAEQNGHAPGGNVVFVDSQIAGYQAIVSAITPGTTVFVFDGTKDGLQQIAQDLQGMHGLQSVDIISHGAADEVLVGTDTLTTSTIPTYAADLTAIGKALAPHGQLDLYGCDVAAAGRARMSGLSRSSRQPIPC
jgi:large repetitive protein